MKNWMLASAEWERPRTPRGERYSDRKLSGAIQFNPGAGELFLGPLHETSCLREEFETAGQLFEGSFESARVCDLRRKISAVL
jgi:hypothetical protein